MKLSKEVVAKLIERYDYGGSLEVLEQVGQEESDLGLFVDGLHYAINFDFHAARSRFYELSEERKEDQFVTEMIKNINELIEGVPDAVFSELVDNLAIQLENEEYIDYLGRVYRSKEAILKYLFVKDHIDRKRFSLHMEAFHKRSILKTLRKKYKIYNGNLTYAITQYFEKYRANDVKAMEILKMLNGDRMEGLVDLRHRSLIGHGFEGVGVNEIYKIYGNPYDVIDDLIDCFHKMDIRIEKYKYNKINNYLLELLEEETL